MPWDPFRPKLLDDAGARHALVALRVLGADDRSSDPAFRNTLNKLTRIRMSRGAMKRVGLGLASGYVCLIVLSITVLRGAPYLAQLGMALAVMLPFVFAADWWHRRGEPDQIAAALLAEGICPVCAYNLAAQPDNADGLVECPECAARWRHSRIVHRHQFAVTATRNLGRPIAEFFGPFLGTDRTTGPKSITDDAGVTRPVVATRLATAIVAASGTHKARLLQAREQMRRKQRTGRLVGAVVLTIILAANAVYLIVMHPAGGAVARVFQAICLLWVAAFVPLATLRGSAGIKPHDIRHAMLAHNLCPSCAADLSAVPPDPEYGGRVCPDCHATWGVRPPPADPLTIPPPDNCPRCRYPLAGLQQDARGGIICPECATQIPLTPRAQARAVAHCPDCQASLAGRTLRGDGQVDCQHCGMWTSHCTQQILDLAALPELEAEG